MESAAWQVLLVGLYVASLDFSDDAIREKIDSAILWASLAAGIYGALQKFGLDFIAWGMEWPGRPASTFGNPNFAAGWWVMIVPFFAGRFFAQKENRWGSGLVAALGLLNLFWGRTLGAWAALAVAIAIVGGVWIAGKKLNIKKIVSLPILIVLGAAAFGTAFWISAQRMPDHQSIQERILKWRTAERIIADHPLTGVGAGNVKVHFALYQAEVSRSMNRSLIGTSESNVHNEYLQITAETGLIGLIAFISIFAVWFYRRAKDADLDAQDIGVSASVLSFLFYSVTNFPFRITPNACLLIYLLAFAEKKSYPTDQPAERRALSSSHYAVIGLIAAAIFWKWILPPFRAEMIRDRAEALKARKDFANAAPLYEQVVQLDYYHSERAAYELGECRRAVGDIPKALEAYQISVRLRNYGEVYNNIGNCYYLLRRFSDAKTNWKKAAELQLPDPQAQAQTIENIQAIERLEQNKI